MLPPSRHCPCFPEGHPRGKSMVDLEDLLLQAAGRTGTSERNSHARPNARRWQKGSYSDESDSSDAADTKGTKSRHSGSQVSRRKKFHPPDNDNMKRNRGSSDGDDRLCDDGSDSAPSVGSDLYKDEEDKDELSKLTELEREMILSERSERIGDHKIKQRLKESSLKRDSKAGGLIPPLTSSHGRSSVRSDKKPAKSATSSELRAKWMKHQDAEAYHKLEDSKTGISALVAPTKDSSPSKQKPTLEKGSLNSFGNEGRSKSYSEGRFHGDSKMEDNLDDDLSPSRLEPLKFEDVKEITIRRSKLAKWCMEPFFEELIVGCFVRVGIGKSRSGIPRYRLCSVHNVDATDTKQQYKLENWTTYKWLNCIWGSSASAARWPMSVVSDSPPLEEEFKEWVQEVERRGVMPSRQEVQEKKEAIRKINSFIYSAATVKQMLQEKKSASSRPINVAAEKDRLRKEMEVAQSNHDEDEVQRIRMRLIELENMSQQAKRQDLKAVRLAEMNKKNRAENFKNASEQKRVKTDLKAGDAGYDPFSRRWTRSTNYYISKPEGSSGNGMSANGDGEGGALVSSRDRKGGGTANAVEAGEAATSAALEAAASAGKLVDTSAPVDKGTESNLLHDFDLPISLASLQNLGGPRGLHAGFMARKQKIEATVGRKVPETDEKLHPLILTVTDYKRRQGLL